MPELKLNNKLAINSTEYDTLGSIGLPARSQRLMTHSRPFTSDAGDLAAIRSSYHTK